MRVEPSASRRSPLIRSLDALVQDGRGAWRNLVKRPGFALLAVATLALGIGANTAAFSVLYGVVLSRLPYPEPERLVRVAELNREARPMSVAGANFEDWEEQAPGFSALTAYQSSRSTVLGGDRPVLAGTAAVSAGFFDALGVRPIVGRATLAEEHREGADPAAVVSHGFWRGRLAGRPLDGATLDVAGFDVRIVGVMPPGFDFPEGTDLWYPMELYPPNPHRSSHNWQVVGRLAPGADRAAVERDLAALTRRIVAEEASAEGAYLDYLATGAVVTPLLDDLAGPVRRPLLLLFGAAVLVLLVACSNLASAFLARGIERQREMAVRVSLGAGPWRLLRQLFAESLLVALVGAAAGLVVAWLTLRVSIDGMAAAIPRLGEIGLHGPVLLFTLAVAVATALLFGVLPGLQLVRRSPSRPLHAAQGGSADRGRRRAWRGLVAVEVALSLVLLVGSGLLLRSLWQLLQEDPGFEPERVATVTVHPPASLYADDDGKRTYFRALAEALAEIPGAVAAGVTSDLPLSELGPSGELEVEGGVRPSLNAGYRLADPGYFEALGIPLLAGRAFERSDDAAAPHVAIVDRAFADTVWPGQSPLGKRVTGGGMDAFWDRDVWATVVGVVGDVRMRDLAQEGRPTAYFPVAQRPGRLWAGTAVVRLAGPAERASAQLGEVVRGLDPNVPFEVRAMDEVVSGSVATQRFAASLLGGFALVGLILAVVGIYGVVSYTVAQRRRELGIRLALGATPPRVRNHVLAGSMATVGAGIVLGLALSVAATRLLRSLLYEVQPADPAVLAGVAALLAATAFGATWLPARETTRIDPVTTLKAE